MDNWYDTIVSNLKTALETIFVKKSDIKDNLTSTDTNKPLSAKQGKVLKDEIGSIHDLIYGVGN